VIFDLINLEKIRRATVYLLLLVAAFFLQNIILARIPIYGVKAMVLPLFPCVVGFFSGGVWGALFGLLTGIFTDMNLERDAVLMTVLFPVFGFLSGALPMFFISRRVFSFFVIGLVALALTAFCQLFPYLVFYDAAPAPLFITAGLQTALSLPFIFVFFYPIRAVSKLDLSK
jgi:dolichyl-phosphate-mannose--protein O-mannosyl transferase